LALPLRDDRVDRLFGFDVMSWLVCQEINDVRSNEWDNLST